jgi:hypothetical protein
MDWFQDALQRNRDSDTTLYLPKLCMGFKRHHTLPIHIGNCIYSRAFSQARTRTSTHYIVYSIGKF